MPRVVAVLGAAFMLASVGLLPTAEADTSGADTLDRTPLGCVESWGEARYRNAGFDHVVHLVSHCSVAAVCDVATNVSPDPRQAAVAPGQHVEVVTFWGAPSRSFVPKVACFAR